MERRLKRQQQVLLLPLLPLRSLPSTPLSGRRSTHVETPPSSLRPPCVRVWWTYVYIRISRCRLASFWSNQTKQTKDGVLLADDGVMAPLASQLADRLCQSVK